MTDPATDDLLMTEVRRGDLGKLSMLFDRHHRALYNFFLRLTGSREASEDLVQDVFLRMLKYRDSYRPGTLFRSWMYRIARNARLDHGRKHPEQAHLADDAAGLESPVPGPQDTLAQRQELALLRAALARLPEEKREVLILSRFQQLSYEEMAELLECTVGAVKVRVHRALEELRSVFRQLSGEGA